MILHVHVSVAKSSLTCIQALSLAWSQHTAPDGRLCVLIDIVLFLYFSAHSHTRVCWVRYYYNGGTGESRWIAPEGWSDVLTMCIGMPM